MGDTETDRCHQARDRKEVRATLGAHDYRHVAISIGRDHVEDAFANGTQYSKENSKNRDLGIEEYDDDYGDNALDKFGGAVRYSALVVIPCRLT